MERKERREVRLDAKKMETNQQKLRIMIVTVFQNNYNKINEVKK